jgi:hypothetical protein
VEGETLEVEQSSESQIFPKKKNPSLICVAVAFSTFTRELPLHPHTKGLVVVSRAARVGPNNCQSLSVAFSASKSSANFLPMLVEHYFIAINVSAAIASLKV